jgi:hypothetical protein
MSISNVTGSTTVGVSNDLVGSGFISVSGGTPPYTYNTVFKSGSTFTLSSATTIAPTFRRAGNPPAGNISGIYTASVTDAAATVKSQDFTVTDNRS